MDTEVYKIRSVGSCMKAAFELYISNLKKIIYRTWLPALLLSICSAFLIQFSLRPSNSLSSSLLILGFCLLVYACATWQNGIVVSLLNGRAFRTNLPRVVRLALLLLLLIIILSLVIVFAGTIPMFIKGMKGISEQTIMFSGIITIATTLLFLLLSIPLWYSSYKYLMQPDTKLIQVIGRDYIRGLAHWGYLFIIVLLTTIFICVIGIVLYMPLAITSQAITLDNYGKVMGDPSGLPSYFSIIAFTTTMIVSFINSYVMLWALVTFYYAYGHIVAKDKAKKEAKAQGNVAVPSNETPIIPQTI